MIFEIAQRPFAIEPVFDNVPRHPLCQAVILGMGLDFGDAFKRKILAHGDGGDGGDGAGNGAGNDCLKSPGDAARSTTLLSIRRA